MEENEQNEDDDFQAQLNEKIKKYFESNTYLTSRDELDNFLTAIDLIDIWNTEDDKNFLWDFLKKYAEDSKINCQNAIQGINDFINQDDNAEKENEEQNNDNNVNKEKKELKESLLTRLSRLSTRGGAGPGKSKLAINKYKQRAIDEYDTLDSNSLIQFKKLFALLKVNIPNGKISFDYLKDICDKHNFIKIDIDDIWRYLSYCVFEENLRNLENKTEFLINNDIMEDLT